jgi:two-component system response regulator LytT
VSDCVDRSLERRPAAALATPLPVRIAARRGRVIVFLDLQEVWACEAADRLTFVHSARGRFDLDLTLSAIGASFRRTLLRAHRNGLVNPLRVVELERDAGATLLRVGAVEGLQNGSVSVPVARERAAAVREALLAGTSGIRRV